MPKLHKALNVSCHFMETFHSTIIIIYFAAFSSCNKGLAIAGGQWLIEVLCFYFAFVLADSFVRNARHRQAPKRWWQSSRHFSVLQKMTNLKTILAITFLLACFGVTGQTGLTKIADSIANT